MTNRLILLALPLLAACATAGATASDLTGTKWTFVSIDGKPPVSSKASLEIQADRIGANVGCNGMGGSLSMAGGKLVTGPLISTKMFCDGLMAQEQTVAELLDGDPAFKVSGDRLVLTAGSHRAELKRAD